MAIRGWENFVHIDGVTNLHPCKIGGHVPKDINGVFYRNGPGMNVVYGEPVKHYIDGDGLVVSLRFPGGGGPPVLSAKFVDTATHKAEKEKRKLVFPGQMGTKPKGWQEEVGKAIAKGDKARLQELFVWRDMAHTNCIYWGGRLLACHEYTFPHLLDPLSLDTIGKFGMGGLFDGTRSLGAHFRLDARQNRIIMVGFRAHPARSRVEIVELTPAWELKSEFRGFVPGLNYVHDILVTPSFYILQMTPFVKMSKDLTTEIISGRRSVGEQMVLYEENGKGKIAVIERSKDSEAGEALKKLPRYAGPVAEDGRPREDTGTASSSSAQQPACTLTVSGHQVGLFCDIEPCHIYHFGYCQEDKHCLRFNACCLPPNFSMYSEDKLWLSNANEAPGELWDYAIDLESGALGRTRTEILHDRRASGFSGEFPTVHPAFHVQTPGRYTYMMGTQSDDVGEGPSLPFRHILRSDRVTKEAKVWKPAAGGSAEDGSGDGISDLIDDTTVVGEPVFITKQGQYPEGDNVDELDGYVLFQYYTPKQHGKSGFALLEARSMETVCVLQYDVHVPYSFHGIWVPIEMVNEHSSQPSATMRTSKI